jgi:uncharacterized YkwD family protein
MNAELEIIILNVLEKRGGVRILKKINENLEEKTIVRQKRRLKIADPKKFRRAKIKSVIFAATIPLIIGTFAFGKSRINRSAPERLRVTASCLNLRGGPSTAFKIHGHAKRGEELDCLGEINGWYVVRLENDAIGMVCGKYVEDATGKNPPPNPEPPPKPERNQSEELPTNPGEIMQDVPMEDNPPSPAPENPPPSSNDANPEAGARDDSANNAATPQVATGADAEKTLSDDEREMFNLVNSARATQKLAPYAANSKLIELARQKSRDMVDKNYFDHQSPTYGSPFDMMKNAGVSYYSAGENIAQNISPRAAHNSLMNSEGHRRNIMSASYNQVGIGIAQGPGGSKTFTQMFIESAE